VVEVVRKEPGRVLVAKALQPELLETGRIDVASVDVTDSEDDCHAIGL
jgi:hypothetical protein